MGRQIELASAYHKLLTSLDWRDELLIAGLREGLNKFLSNAHLAMFRGANKYHKTHFISRRALELIGRPQGLVWEHLVPKQRYIQDPCEEKAAAGNLTVEYVDDLLQRYWRLATITREEDRLLSRTTMPDSWDGLDCRARYRGLGIELIDNPYFQKCVKEAG